MAHWVIVNDRGDSWWDGYAWVDEDDAVWYDDPRFQDTLIPQEMPSGGRWQKAS